MNTTLKIIFSLFIVCNAFIIKAQVTFNKSLIMIPASTADGEITGVSDFSLTGTIFLDGNAYVSNQGGASTIKLGATGNTTSVGANNIFIGTEAGKALSLLGDGENVFIGYQANKNNSDFSADNVSIGSQTGMNNLNGQRNTFIGYQAGYNNSTGDANTFLGYQAGYNNLTGTYNLFFGTNAGKNNKSGSYNVAIGYNAGLTLNSTFYSSFIGVNADIVTTDVYASVAIGYNSKVDKDNSIVFGSTTDPIQLGINTTTPRADVDINSTGAMIVPVGQGIERPTTPVKGMIRFNSVTNKLEGYDGTTWINFN